MDFENFDREEEKRKIKERLKKEHIRKELEEEARKELEEEGFYGTTAGNVNMVDLTNRDKLFDDCARTVVQSQSGSTSMLQRKFNLGYNRACRIMDQLEAADIVGPFAGTQRDVLIQTEADLEQLLLTL